MHFTSRTVILVYFAVLSLLAACSPKPTHFVDQNTLSTFKARPTTIGRIFVPCSFQNSMILGGTVLKEQQLSMLNNMHPEEVMQVLKDAYGLEPATHKELDIKSDTMHFMALFSKSRGRCFYQENSSVSPDENVIDISFYTNESCPLSSGCSASLLYDVVVRQNDNIFMRHSDEFSLIKFKMFIGDKEISEMIASAGKISEALRQDLNKTWKTVPNEKN